MKKRTKFLSVLTVVALLCAIAIPFASAADIKVYEKDIFLNDDNAANSGWKIIADDPGFYYGANEEAIHKSPSLWNQTSKSDPNFSWKYDTSDFKNGSSSLSQTYSTGFFYYWLTEFSGKTLDITNTQYLLMDLYVEDAALFLNAHEFRIDFTDSTNKNDLKWDAYGVGVSRDTLKGTFLRKGWNSLKLYLGGVENPDKINLKAITGIRFFAVGLSGEATHTIKLDNVHLVSKKYTTQAAESTVQVSSQQATASAANNSSKNNTPGTTVNTSSTTASAAGSTAAVVSNNAEASNAELPSNTVVDNTPVDSQAEQISAPSDEMTNNDTSEETPKSMLWVVIVIILVVVAAAAVVVFIVIKRQKAAR